MSNNDLKEKDYSLYTEKIVVKPSVKYRTLIKLGKISLAAILFGLIASVVMAVVYPFLSQNTKEKKQELVISKDEYPTEEETDEDAQAETSQSQSSDINQNFKNTTHMLQQMSSQIQNSILSLDIYEAKVGDFISETESPTETVGLVVGNVNNEFIILTDYGTVANSETVIIKLEGSKEVKAAVIGSDDTTGLSVLSVNQSDIPSNIRAMIQVANLDNSYKVKQGDMVIASGKLYGKTKSVDYGTISNISSINETDNCYSLLNTGIHYVQGDFGFLFNVDGNVIGIASKKSDDTFSAIGISSLKSTIEAITNGRKIAYMGIKGQNVTSPLAVSYGLPMGIYVTDVLVDSPAYVAGIQPGDVICKVDGIIVLTIQSFSEKLYQCYSGQEMVITVKRAGKDDYNEMEFHVTVSLR